MGWRYHTLLFLHEALKLDCLLDILTRHLAREQDLTGPVWEKLKVQPVRGVGARASPALGCPSQMRPESSIAATPARSGVVSRWKPKVVSRDMCTATLALAQGQRFQKGIPSKSATAYMTPISRQRLTWRDMNLRTCSSLGQRSLYGRPRF